MFGLFKRRPPKEMFHKDLPSRERITLVLEEFIVPSLTEAGFRFKRRELEFHRKRENGIREEFKVWTHHYNSKATGQAMFRPTVTIGYALFDAFCTAMRGSKDPTTVWYGLPAELPGATEDWSHDGYYDLGAHDNRRIMEACKHNIVDILLPELNALSTPDHLIAFLEIVGKERTHTSFLLAVMNSDRQTAERLLARFEKDTAKDRDHAWRAARLEEFRKILSTIA